MLCLGVLCRVPPHLLLCVVWVTPGPIVAAPVGALVCAAGSNKPSPRQRVFVQELQQRGPSSCDAADGPGVVRTSPRTGCRPHGLLLVCTAPKQGVKLVMSGQCLPWPVTDAAVPGDPHQRCWRHQRVSRQFECPCCCSVPLVHWGWHLPATQINVPLLQLVAVWAVPAADTWPWSLAMQGLGTLMYPQALRHHNSPIFRILWISAGSP